MYDPTQGRWLSQDPIGFDSGQTNLSEYVGDNPTNATDPSGLEKPGFLPTYSQREVNEARRWMVIYDRDNLIDQPLGGDFSAKVSFHQGFGMGDGFTMVQKKEIRAATLGAAKLIQRTYDGLSDDKTWGLIKARGTKGYKEKEGDSPKAITDATVTYLNTGTNRQDWIKQLKKALDALKNPDYKIEFENDLDFNDGNEVFLYTKAVFNVDAFTRPTMYVTARFYRIGNAETQADKMSHELGRSILHLSGDLVGDPIVQFDSIVNYINQEYINLEKKGLLRK